MPDEQFDEKAQEALSLLMEHFWILRNEQPRAYQLIREREKVLLRYVEEKLGFRLIVHRHFVKLEKIPVEPREWMGIQTLQKPRDYAVFCCALAFLEEKAVDDRFLLSDICEDIRDMFPGDLAIDWTNYDDRKSLVRAIKTMNELHLIETLDGETERFAQDEAQEVLYRVPVYARYFMRTYPKDLRTFFSYDEILEAEWEMQKTDERRKRVYRQLFLNPVVHRTSSDDGDFDYIRKYRNRLRDDVESHTPYRLEVFKNAAFLTLDERKKFYTLFPNTKAISDIVVQFSALIRHERLPDQADEYGQIRLTPGEYEQLLMLLKAQYGNGWSKEYREMTPAELGREVLAFLQHWEMGTEETETNMIVLFPLLGRVTGDYPDDFHHEQ